MNSGHEYNQYKCKNMDNWGLNIDLVYDVDIPIDINCDCSIIRAKTNSYREWKMQGMYLLMKWPKALLFVNEYICMYSNTLLTT